VQRFTRVSHPVIITGFADPWLGLAGLKVRNTLRIVGISLALVALLVFATGVVSDWNHQNSNDETRCPYCHLGHQTPAELEATPAFSLLRPVASLPLPEDFAVAAGPIFSQISPRAPPAA